MENHRPNAGRYEFWLYRQISKRFQAGEFHLNDSLRHRHLSDELVPEGEQAAVLAEMNVWRGSLQPFDRCGWDVTPKYCPYQRF